VERGKGAITNNQETTTKVKAQISKVKTTLQRSKRTRDDLRFTKINFWKREGSSSFDLLVILRFEVGDFTKRRKY
jgi:hypothetical protein